METMTAAQFNRMPSAVKRTVLSSDDPVMVTDRDRPTLVVMKYVDYLHLTSKNMDANPADWLEMDDDIDFEPATIELGLQVVNL